MLVSDLKAALFKYGFNDEDPWLQWLNEGYHEIEIENPQWSFLVVTETVALASGSVVVATTQTMKRPVKIRDITGESSSGGEGEDLEYMDLPQFERNFGNHKEIGNPQYYTVRGKAVEVYPVPSGDREIQVTYIKELSDLAEETEEPLMPPSFHFCIVYKAAAVGLMGENEEERANTAESQFINKLERLVSDDREKQVGEPEYVEIVD
jgi:hypothetical protein